MRLLHCLDSACVPLDVESVVCQSEIVGVPQSVKGSLGKILKLHIAQVACDC